MKFLHIIVLSTIYLISCGSSESTKSFSQSVTLDTKQQKYDCEVKWSQTWLPNNAQDFAATEKITYTKKIELDLSSKKEIAMIPTEMKAGTLDISASPNINTFKITLKPVVDDADFYRNIEADPKKTTIVDMSMLVVVRDNPRNTSSSKYEFVDHSNDGFRFLQEIAFGPERKEVGLAQSSVDDFETPNTFAAKAPSVNLDIKCKVKK